MFDWIRVWWKNRRLKRYNIGAVKNLARGKRQAFMSTYAADFRQRSGENGMSNDGVLH